jgi:gamma-glutamyltranspeptidase/glutathione hydrolase
VVEALKLAFADREAFYGDPEFVNVPIAELLGVDYARERAALIQSDRAWPEMPPPGNPLRGVRGRDPKSVKGMSAALAPHRSPPDEGGTSYVCVVDRHGNAFSATPSDVSFDTPIIPGTGLAVSSRGSQSRVDTDHPAGLAPGKRPRLTPNPAIVFRDGRIFMPFGTPGGDVQCQAMLQVFLNLTTFGMDPQQAVEAPRVATWSFPASNAPYPYLPGRVNVEAGIDPAVADELARLGHEVAWWPQMTWKAGAVCAIVVDPVTGVMSAGADPRRESYAMGW